MAEKEIIVMCCFCGEKVFLNAAVQIVIIPSQTSNEKQGVYCHRKCLDIVLHKDVPRHPDLIEYE
jgi:hypothetical protein